MAGQRAQLEHVIERAVVMADGPAVTTTELPPEVLAALEAEPVPSAARRTVQRERDGATSAERERLVRALAAADGNKAEAARALGLARSTLLSRLKKHGLS